MSLIDERKTDGGRVSLSEITGRNGPRALVWLGGDDASLVPDDALWLGLRLWQWAVEKNLDEDGRWNPIFQRCCDLVEALDDEGRQHVLKALRVMYPEGKEEDAAGR